VRKLAWAATGFAAAVFLAEYVLPLEGLLYSAAALFLVWGLGFLWKKYRWQRGLCLGFAVLGLLAWRGHYLRHVQPCEALVGQTITVTVRATDYASDRGSYTTLPVRVMDGAPTERGVLFFYGETPADVEPGDILSVTVVVKSPKCSYTAQGQNFLANAQEAGQHLGTWAYRWLYTPQRLAQWVKNQCDRLFSGQQAAFMKALLTGDTVDLKNQEPLYGNMNRAGVLHIVAISGMHLAVLVALAQLLLGCSRRTSLLCLPMLVVFTLMAGCRASVVRAAVMQVFVLLAPWFDRENDPVTSLMGALLLLLGINPMAVAGVGLQLSFACMAGYALVLHPVKAWTVRHLPVGNVVVDFVVDNAVCTLCATVFSLPLAAYYFGTISLLTVAANLLTLPVVEVCFAGGYILCVLGALLPPVGVVGSWVLGWLLSWCSGVYGVVASVPFACLYTVKTGAVVWLVGLYALAGLWLWAKRRNFPLSGWVVVEIGTIGLCLVLLTDGVTLTASQGELSVLDVGQGQCVALTDGSAAVLIDCGGSGTDNAGDVAADYLLASGKSRVNVLILTHLHADHTNGVERLLSRMAVDYLVLPAGTEDEQDVLDTITQAAQEQGTVVVTLAQPCQVQAGNMTLELYLPNAGSDINERGIVVLAQEQDTTALIMGDGGTAAEWELLSQNLVPDVDILVVGHHGSKTASGALFLQQAQAETAIVSVGYNNYGLPAEEILQRLEEYCLQVLRTDQAGTVTIDMKTDEEEYG
jgi:competence protein ComEC